MNPGNDFVQIRHGLVEAGDKIYLPMLGSHVEVTHDSVFAGSAVSAHKSVWRPSHKVTTRPTFANSTERCDYVSEMDFVVLQQADMFDLHRVVVAKDAEFVYLRPVARSGTAGHPSTTTNKVCRRTGKTWKWEATGWVAMPGTQMRAEGEVPSVDLSKKSEVVDAAFYGD